MNPLIIPAQPGWRIVDKIMSAKDLDKLEDVALGESIIAWSIVTEARSPKDVKDGMAAFWIEVTPITCEGLCENYAALRSPDDIISLPYVAGPYSSFEEFRTVVASEPGLVS